MTRCPHWMLWDGQKHLATHTTRLACVIEAIERKLVLRNGIDCRQPGQMTLRDGVEIIKIGK